MATHDIIVVGASAGGVEALSRLVGGFTSDLHASVFIVLHTTPGDRGMLAPILDRASALPVEAAENGEKIRRGRIYVARPDHHLMLMDGTVVVVHAPRENLWRPAVDPLFRSAAVAYRTRVIGAILGGYLNDGTAGLAAVKRCGGIAVVQDPADTLYPDMPRNAMKGTKVDRIVRLDDMAPLLEKLSRRQAPKPRPVPRDLRRETEGLLDYWKGNGVKRNNELGTLSPYTCPECGGSLWRLPGKHVQRFRCQIGHGYTEESLLADQSDVIDRALAAALRSMEQRVNILSDLAEGEKHSDQAQAARIYRKEAEEVRKHANFIRQMLQR